MDKERLADLIRQLQFHFLTVKLGISGQVVYYEEPSKLVILGVHSTGAEKTQQAAESAWNSLSDEWKEQLKGLDVGFAVKQI